MSVRKFFHKLISLISTACYLFELINAVSFGPPLVSLTRWDRFVRGPTIFNPDTGRVISLEDYPNYSVVIPLGPESPTATSNQVFISRRVSGPGEFHVEAPAGHGVMAVIQSLDLRVADDTCNDFILFSDVDGGGIETTGTCGKVDIRDSSYAPQGLLGPRAFVSPSGKMRVLFYHGFIWGLVRNFNFDLLDPSLNPMLRVEIAFTAIKDCPSANTTDVVQTDTYSNLNSLISCSPSAPNNTKTCISKELFCDRNLNCAFEQDFGSDEDLLLCHEQFNIAFSKSQHSPPTTIASTTTGTSSSSTTTSATTTTTTSTSTEATTSAQPTPTTPKSTNTSGTGEARVYKKQSTGTDAAGLIGLVRKFPLLIKTTTSSTTPTSKDDGVVKIYERKSGKIQSNYSTTKTTKMPFASGGELFADIKSDPVEDSLIDGASKEIIEGDTMSPQTIVGIVSIVAVVLILCGVLRVWYCYNKVIWNPHGSLPSNGTPPEFPNPGIMRKIKQLVAESEEGFNEKKCIGLKEQPPSYEILFPLPEETVENKNFKV